MKSPQLPQGLFDLHCWHINNTTCHQSSFQLKEPQLTYELSPLLSLRKVGALNFGRLTAFFKRVFGGRVGITVIWDVKNGGRVQLCWLVGLVKWMGAGFVLKTLLCPPGTLLNLFLQLPSLSICKQTNSMATFAHFLVIRELLFLTQKPTHLPQSHSQTPLNYY